MRFSDEKTSHLSLSFSVGEISRHKHRNTFFNFLITKIMKLRLLFTSIVLLAIGHASSNENQRVLSTNDIKTKNGLKVKTIIHNHDKPDVLEAHTKKFGGETLAYVTPWNNRGELLKKTRKKIGKLISM